MSVEVTMTALAAEFDIDRAVVRRLIDRGIIPARSTAGGQWRIGRDAAESVLRVYLAARAAKVGRVGKCCSVCKRDLPLDAFVIATSYAKGVRYRYPSSDCKACRAALKRRQRAERAAEEGRPFRPGHRLRSDEIEARERRGREEQERRSAERAARKAQRETAPRLPCRTCGKEKARRAFYSYHLGECRDCFLAYGRARFRRQRDELSDVYVARVIRKWNPAIRREDIPVVMLEAKRAQMQITRIVGGRGHVRRDHLTTEEENHEQG